MATSFSYIAQVSTLSRPPWSRPYTALVKLKIFKANLILGKFGFGQILYISVQRGIYISHIGKWIQCSWALPYKVLFSEKINDVIFSPAHFPCSKIKVKIGSLLLKKSSNHDQTMTSELAVAIVCLNAEFKKGQFLNLFSVDKSNLCTMATYIESNLLGKFTRTFIVLLYPSPVSQ